MFVGVTSTEVGNDHIAELLSRFDVGLEVGLDVVQVVFDGLFERDLADHCILVDAAGQPHIRIGL